MNTVSTAWECSGDWVVLSQHVIHTFTAMKCAKCLSKKTQQGQQLLGEWERTVLDRVEQSVLPFVSFNLTVLYKIKHY